MKTLKNYSQKLLEVQLFKKNNAQVFSDLEKLQDELLELEAKLKLEVKKTMKDVENDVVKVSVSERWHKYYSYDKFYSYADKKEINILEKAKGFIKEIDKVVFDECVKQNLISRETKQACFEEKLLNKMVIIKSKI